MTDLTIVLPGFRTSQYARLLSVLEKNLVTTADLLTLDFLEIAKRTQLPLLEIKRLSNAVLEALQGDLEIISVAGQVPNNVGFKKLGRDILNSWNNVSTLDDDLDRALGGGIPVGYVTEITGESGAGKTQLLLTLLLAAQLPSPIGLSSRALYISTESALPTTRLSQLLRTHPAIVNLDPKPSLDAVISIVTPDLESQDHILRFQVPVAIKQYDIRLLILDSVAANYRAEFERPGAGNGQSGGANMAQRSSELVKLGQLLRDLARDHDIAVVVANQVADRFSPEIRNSSAGNSSPSVMGANQSSPLARRGTRGQGGGGQLPKSSLGGPMTSTIEGTKAFKITMDPMSLDHQQRWFTGWGDEQYPSYLTLKNQKTPSLGLIWTTQIACRIALIKRPVYGPILVSDEDTDRGEPVLRRWRRWMKVVFAPHVAPSGSGLKSAVEFEIKGEGIKAVEKNMKKAEDADEDEDEDEDVTKVMI